ncbi:MAG TPA: 1-deoxy-D-xylulose-5-phosphate reductoisomerase [Candidatus Dormibacteraeota bacterium]|nr:1-deoxy-D-xylulose-5-phosphate reductoisomerase [Candidatus Dormibacteraeota bacterium]
MKKIAILGCTGSIGRQCLQVVDALPGRFEVVSMAAGSNVALVAEQVKRHRPKVVSVGTEQAEIELRASLAAGIAGDGKSRNGGALPEILFGAEGIERVATHPEAEMVVSAAVGVVGLPATYKAIQQGKHIALANKEVLVAAGELVMAAVERQGVALLPVDSEHNAIHQCMRGGERGEVKRLVLTASGGPFRKTPVSELENVTPEQALAHPNWKMGQRITIDSATLMNKGFEVIEARWLFGMPLEKIQVVIHPQSTVHSMVEYVDGSILAQLGPTDMRMPIQYALTYPERVASKECALDWSSLSRLDFEAVPSGKFPCLELAREALRQGGLLPCALNAADEVAIAAFLERKLPFLGIPKVIEGVLGRMPRAALSSIDELVAGDAEARRLAHDEISRQYSAVKQVS